MVTKKVRIRFLVMVAIVLCGCFSPIARVQAVDKPADATWIVNDGGEPCVVSIIWGYADYRR